MSCQVDNVLNVARQKTMLTSQDHYQQMVAFMLVCISRLLIEAYEFFNCRKLRFQSIKEIFL